MILFTPRKTFRVNRISIGDKHDTSLEFVISTTFFDDYLIKRTPMGFEITGGVAIERDEEEEEEAPPIRKKKDKSKKMKWLNKNAVQ